MSEINKYIRSVVNFTNLSKEEVMRAIQIISLGGATPAQISAFFTAYKMKGFTSEELAGAGECIRLKNKPIEYNQKGLYLTLKPEHLDIWFPAALICSAINIPVYICTERYENLNIIQHLGLSLDLNRESILECLKFCKMCVSYPTNNHIQRNIIPTLEELEFDNFFDYANALAYPIEPLALVFETDSKYLENYKEALRINNIESALIMSDEEDILMINHETKSIKDKLDLTNHEYKDSISDKIAQIRAFCAGVETKHKQDVMNRAAILLLLAKAAKDFKEAYELANETFSKGRASAIIEKLALITNQLGIDEDEAIQG